MDAPGSDLSTKQTYVRWWIHRLTIKSRILTFFFSGSHVIEDPDSGIAAMSLVCALILTIPFGCFSFLNDDYFSSLKTSLQLCAGGTSFSGQTFDMIHTFIMRSVSACLFFSIMGLIISSIYYVFKPIPGSDLKIWCENQGRYLVGSLFIITALDVVGLMALGHCLMEYSAISIDSVCTFNVAPLFTPGIYGVVVSFSVGLVCML